MIPVAHAVLDMGAIRHNLARVKQSAPSAKVMAVIKANAYGHGLVRFAKALEQADAFAVARVDEGVLLREAGITKRIAVLQGFVCTEELELHARYGLEPVIHSVLQVDLLEQSTLTGPISIWLKMDSGMHRLGLNEDELPRCFERLQQIPSVLKPIPTMTHLANADVLSDPVTGKQLDLFWDTVAGLRGDRSIANSAGLLAWDRAVADWVRPGIVLYGVSPFPHRTAEQDDLRPVMTLRSKLIAIKELKAGDAIGYGDGYPRHARSGTPVLVRGRRVPLVGRVSMDMITVELNDCPEAVVGDEVTLWGDGLPVEEVARHADTIPYELLCGITSRVRIVETSR